MAEKIRKTDDEWRQQLTPEQFRITRQKGTEPAFTGKYNSSKEPGVYRCVCCGNVLFDSEAKFDSGTGWPSFYEPAAPDSVATETDRSLFMTRTEVMCSSCDAHLGHVFDDGPKPTGLRIRNAGRLAVSSMTIAGVSTGIGCEAHAALAARNAPVTAFLTVPHARMRATSS